MLDIYFCINQIKKLIIWRGYLVNRLKLVNDEMEEIEEYVHRWGGSASEVAFDLPCKCFSIPHVEGVICYRIEAGCAVIIGDPLCSQENAPLLAQAFQRFCEENHLNTIYVIASEKFAKWAIKNISKALVEVCTELIFDPQLDLMAGHSAIKLRNYTNHARHLGLTVEEYLSDDPQIEQSIREVGEKWVKARRGLQIYLSPLDFFENRTDKRWFYVRNGATIVGAALLSRLESKQGWLLKFLIVLSGTPRGTSELLMTSILDTLRKEQCKYLTSGMVPVRSLGEIIGLSKFSEWMARATFKVAKWIFKLNQRRTYWDKFHPRTEKAYVLFNKPHIGQQEIRAILKSLTID